MSGRPQTGTAQSAQGMRTGMPADMPAETSARTGMRAESRPGERSSLASSNGTPAVLGHHVVALRVVEGPQPLRLCTEDGEYPLVPLEAQVWARAGRLTVVTHDGAERKMTVLGADEGTGLHLGDRWPPGEHESRARRAASAAAHDVGHALTFPAWLNRTTRLSGQRNVALHGLVKRLRQASPGMAVYYGQTFGFEHASDDQHHPYDHRGLVGRHGYPTEL